ncbi:hypothetical protein HZH66_001813 [Vespula vulgaris]|uniref:Uncharacterized protein n=1 Tax=Vespula vulgaris TaxID=7454 RepID=A0A834KK03_VESVU|nr:hypothetical protein HZH66_001813 [Vespula vulgaris]
MYIRKWGLPACGPFTAAAAGLVKSCFTSSPVRLAAKGGEVVAWTATLLLVSSCLGIADAGVLMSHPLATASCTLQKKLLHHRLLQGMLGRIIINGRDGEDPNVDQATPWGRSRGLGKTASALNTS